MRAEYDFSKAKRGALVPSKGKTRITIHIDDAVLDEFRARAEKLGSGYQTMMNEALKAYLAETDERHSRSRCSAELFARNCRQNPGQQSVQRGVRGRRHVNAGVALHRGPTSLTAGKKIRPLFSV
jgi:hypothetical protein